ncbi:unnamed protein product [Acanthoscelides obtectus]|uniref:Uncharacterized protein n=1 Tax=Acanthoscelides obtectus TaxID=200917 RepID=A0A9P0JLL8_ACAOB|nr:unnamed protein product [Acanthoscelides obtectus]CAK1634659.1 hypothetical protein AOBTE_LOCUS8856 [Acanthoscelides obtectus]
MLHCLFTRSDPRLCHRQITNYCTNKLRHPAQYNKNQNFRTSCQRNWENQFEIDFYFLNTSEGYTPKERWK